jgi:hypothetical protein
MLCLFYAAWLYFLRIYDLLFKYNKRKHVNLFLSLSFTHFTIIHKKRTSLLSGKIGTDSSNYGKMDTFESTYWWLYLLLLLASTVNRYTLWPSSFICGCNANNFMKETHQEPLCYNSRRFDQGYNKKFMQPSLFCYWIVINILVLYRR